MEKFMTLTRAPLLLILVLLTAFPLTAEPGWIQQPLVMDRTVLSPVDHFEYSSVSWFKPKKTDVPVVVPSVPISTELNKEIMDLYVTAKTSKAMLRFHLLYMIPLCAACALGGYAYAHQ